MDARDKILARLHTVQLVLKSLAPIARLDSEDWRAISAQLTILGEEIDAIRADIKRCLASQGENK